MSLLAMGRRLAPSLLRNQEAAGMMMPALQQGLGLRGFASPPPPPGGEEDEGLDTHDDFKPQFKQGEPASVESTIDSDVKGNSVFLYMKGVPEAPMCGFSSMAVRILDAYGVRYGSRNVLADPDVRDGIKQYTSWPTIPQVFIGGEFVGGSDILLTMHQSGELKDALEKAAQEAQQQGGGSGGEQ